MVNSTVSTSAQLQYHYCLCRIGSTSWRTAEFQEAFASIGNVCRPPACPSPSDPPPSSSIMQAGVSSSLSELRKAPCRTDLSSHSAMEGSTHEPTLPTKFRYRLHCILVAGTNVGRYKANIKRWHCLECFPSHGNEGNPSLTSHLGVTCMLSYPG